MNKLALFLSAGMTTVMVASPAAIAATQIQWWHAMGGENGAKL
jgi:sn-glycerol 3-phosphate transport system substrate-binding protein